MAGLTIAEAAGLIALAAAAVAFLGPNAIALLTATRIGHKRSAVTWSVVGRELQSSNWPLFLRTETSASTDIPWSIGMLCWLQKLAWVLVTVAGIVTPLGLRSEIQLDPSPRAVEFRPVHDTGPVGRGTPPRDPTAFFNRICSRTVFHSALFSVPVSCPYSDTDVFTVAQNETSVTVDWDGTYDVRIPYTTAEIFSSFQDEHQESVSGAFDIQWRQYTYKAIAYENTSFNNHKPFQVGVYRPLDNLLLDDTVEAIDGLIVNTRDGGIAFRNHTGPGDIEIGGEWQEDLLFVSPETVCVDTNLTYDFQITDPGASLNFTLFSGVIMNLTLTDRGGFSNINQTNPDPVGSHYSGQRGLDLRRRAYTGAWFNNVYSMYYFNITNPSIGKYKHAFNYMNSHVGKKLYLDAATNTASPNLLQTSLAYGTYIPYGDYYNYSNGAFVRYNDSYDDPRTVFYNPFRITSDNFTTASILCSGAGSGDQANITNIGVACGLMFGAARRTDGQSSLIFSPGSWWTQPIYSCATALKADIKEVTFSWNITTKEDNPLRKLNVQKIEDKIYKSQAEEPFWGVENFHRDLIRNNPLWGLVSSKTAKLYENDRFLNTSHSPRLYLPGYTGEWDWFPSAVAPDGNNLATANAFVGGLTHAYSVDYQSPYTGSSSLSLFSKWQDLSRSAETAFNIPNLLWTDIMANALVGTRSRLSNNALPHDIQPKLAPPASPNKKRDTAKEHLQTRVEVPIRLYRDKVTYHWLFAIPALLSITLLALMLVIILCLTVVGRMAGPSTLRFYLNWTSAGRLLATLKDQQATNSTIETTSYREDSSDNQSATTSLKKETLVSVGEEHHMNTPSSQWIKTEGQRMIDLNALSKTYAGSSASLHTVNKGEYISVSAGSNTEFVSSDPSTIQDEVAP